MYKLCLKEAAKVVTEKMQLESSNENASRRFVLAIISRVIWFNKTSVARRLMRTSDVGREALQV